MCFHVYHLVICCTVHGILPIGEKKHFHLCLYDTAYVSPIKTYTRKEIVMMVTYIADFHTRLYIPEIQKLDFHLPHVQILRTHHCRNALFEALKCCREFQDVLCSCDHKKIVVYSCAHQIQS